MNGAARGITIRLRGKLTYRRLLHSLVFLEPSVVIQQRRVVFRYSSEKKGFYARFGVFDNYSNFFNVVFDRNEALTVCNCGGSGSS
ncbi:hypothetical protein TNCV_1378081 [Trichonephila clavipes]|nr:hypothetical protein TNCV_1378081 [Trichonephila clavipes]